MALSNGAHVNGIADDASTLPRESVTSPYSTRPITIKIGPNGAEFGAFEAMVERYPGLESRLKDKKPGTALELPEVHEDVGHTLIHFLFTGEYNTIGLGGIPGHLRAVAEFSKSVLTYCASRYCTIGPLEVVTKAKMDHYSKQISVFELHTVVVDVAPSLPPDEVWFPEHLYRWIKDALQDDDKLIGDEHLLELVGQSLLFDKAVVRSISELYKEKAAAVKIFAQAPETETGLVTADVELANQPNAVVQNGDDNSTNSVDLATNPVVVDDNESTSHLDGALYANG